MTVKILRQPVDSNSNYVMAPPIDCDSNNLLLAAATNESITVPTGAKCVTLSASAEAWVGLSTFGVTVPAIDASTGTAGIVLRAGTYQTFSVEGVTTLHFIAAATPLVNIVFF